MRGYSLARQVPSQGGADHGGDRCGVSAVPGGPAGQPTGDDAFLLGGMPRPSRWVRPYHNTPPTYSASSRPSPGNDS